MSKYKIGSVYSCACCKTIARLATEDAEGNKGAISVSYDGLTSEEHRSLRMGVPVPYIESEHKKLAHIVFCDKEITRCRTCGEQLVFFATKPNPEKNGHNEPGKMPMDWKKITKAQRYRIIKGLPVKYIALEHSDNNHFANKDCK